MHARGVLQERDAVAGHDFREGCVDVAAFLDAAFQVRLVEVGERAAGVIDRAPQLVLVAGGRGVGCVVDGGTSEGGDLGADWAEESCGGGVGGRD